LESVIDRLHDAVGRRLLIGPPEEGRSSDGRSIKFEIDVAKRAAGSYKHLICSTGICNVA
jgi:hypothetical protein